MKKAGLLTEKQRKYIADPKERNRYTKSVQRQYDHRIRKKARRMMQDLRFLAAHLPESQQEQIFTKENFLPMVEAVLSSKRPDIGKDLKKKMKTEWKHRLIIVENERIFSLCNALIEIAALAGRELIPSEIVTALSVSPDAESIIQTVRRIGVFFK